MEMRRFLLIFSRIDKKCVHHDKSKNHRKTVDVRTYHLFSLSPFPCCQGATVCVSLQNIMCQSLPFFANHCSVHREDKGAAGKRFLLCWEEKADKETDYCRFLQLREATFWNVFFSIRIYVYTAIAQIALPPCKHGIKCSKPSWQVFTPLGKRGQTTKPSWQAFKKGLPKERYYRGFNFGNFSVSLRQHFPWVFADLFSICACPSFFAHFWS